MASNAIEPKVVFMGTPQFAVPSLRALAEGPYMLTVVTQPDRPAGRRAQLTPPPVKVAAEELGFPVWQPESLKDPDFRAKLAELRPDLTVLVAYGEYLAPSLLDLPRKGSINLHPSLLPRWRGSTPIQSAILAGDDVTGASVILMDRGLDTGPILAQKSIPIETDETTPQLSEKLAEAGARLLAETLPLWLRGEIEPVAQRDEGATLTTQLKKEDGLIDWTMPAAEIERRVRGLQPWPGTFTHWQGRQLKILKAGVESLPDPGSSQPGNVVVAGGPQRRRVLVATGGGALRIEQAQFEGKPVIEARALLSGYPQIAGSRLGAREAA